MTMTFLPGKPLDKENDPVPINCGTCGDRKCRRKWRVLRWTDCKRWRPEVLPLDKLPETDTSQRGG